MIAVQPAPIPARERILIAAECVVTDVGAGRMTLDGVAQAAGVSKGGLLYHFPSKESLVVALAQRYVDSMHHCIDGAKIGMPEGGAGRDLKACILGVLGSDPRSKAMGSALLAAASNDPGLLDVIRTCIAKQTEDLATSRADFALGSIVTLAIDGLKMRESLRISCFSGEQRELVVQALLKMADEAYR
jgi:AcrR family transcriptional regulator